MSCLPANTVYYVTHMQKTLLDLVEILKSKNLEYAVFNWTAQDRFSEWFEAAAYLNGESYKVDEEYQEAAADLLRLHYPKYDHFLGTYGEVYVYPEGKISIVLTERVYGEEHHRKDLDFAYHPCL